MDVWLWRRAFDFTFAVSTVSSVHGSINININSWINNSRYAHNSLANED